MVSGEFSTWYLSPTMASMGCICGAVVEIKRGEDGALPRPQATNF